MNGWEWLHKLPLWFQMLFASSFAISITILSISIRRFLLLLSRKKIKAKGLTVENDYKRRTTDKK